MTFKSITGLWMLLFLISQTYAQQTNGNLEGTIQDFFSKVVPNAEITAKLKSDTIQFTKTTRSNEKGEFVFLDILSGVYEVEVKSANKVVFKKRGFWIRAGETAKYTIEFGTDCSDESGRTISFFESEKAEIINQFLEGVMKGKQKPNFQHLLNRNGTLILSTKNIEPNWIKLSEKNNLKLMSEAEIVKKAQESGDFLHLSFTEFKVKGDCLLVSFGYDWLNPSDPNNSQRDPQGASFIYRKESGKIVSRLVSDWIR